MFGQNAIVVAEWGVADRRPDVRGDLEIKGHSRFLRQEVMGMSPLPLALRGVRGQLAVARGVEDFDAITSLGLGDVQRDIGAARHLVEQHVAGLVTGESEAERHRHILLVDAHALIAQRIAQSVGGLPRLV